jgi:hypothetical protein
MDLEPKKNPFKKLIKNTYKENEFAKDILATLYKLKGYKVRC